MWGSSISWGLVRSWSGAKQGARTGIISGESYSVHSVEYVSILVYNFHWEFWRMDSMPASGTLKIFDLLRKLFEAEQAPDTKLIWRTSYPLLWRVVSWTFLSESPCDSAIRLSRSRYRSVVSDIFLNSGIINDHFFTFVGFLDFPPGLSPESVVCDNFWGYSFSPSLCSTQRFLRSCCHPKGTAAHLL